MIIYEGPSKLNSEPIVAILTKGSKNRKTGAMGQLWILPQSEAPVTSVQTGKDEAVCGNCPMRRLKGGACYVNPGHGPQAVWKAWKRGRYENSGLKNLEPFAEIRLGAWGDPAALPFGVVKRLLKASKSHTGYTHQWRTCDPRLKGLVMASCDTEKDYFEAKRAGWRTFRVVSEYDEMLPSERVCANDSHGIQCADCMACHGGYGADIVIKVHGTLAGKRWERVREILSLELEKAS